MKGDWLVLGHSDCLQSLPMPQQCQSDEYTADGVSEFAFIDTTDISSKEDSLTIVRMVGELDVIAVPVMAIGTTQPIAASMLVQVDEMIHKVTTGDGGAVALLDPRRELSGENDDIMWRRRTHIAIEGSIPTASNGSLLAISYDPHEYSSPHLDIRVKRRLVQGDELIWAYGATVVQFTSNVLDLTEMLGTFRMFVSFNMRGYVKF